MRVKPALNLLGAVAVFLAHLLILEGCASIKLPDVETNPPSQYRLFQEQENLSIAIDPFLEKERVKSLFGLDLLAEGIIPVLVVAENMNKSCSYYLLKDAFQLEVANPKSLAMIKEPEPSKPYRQIDTVSSISKVLPIISFIAPASIVAWPYLFKAQTDPQVIIYNLKKKELLEKTLSFGDSQHGFAYFKFDQKIALKELFAVYIKVARLQEGDVLTFVFKLAKQ